MNTFPDLKPGLERSRIVDDKNIVFMDHDQIKYLLDEISNILSKEGFKKNAKLNAFGRFIEYTIDPLSLALCGSDV